MLGPHRQGRRPGAPGTIQFVHLVVSDIVAAREELVRKGVDASEVFHDAAGGYNRFDKNARASGPIRSGAATRRSLIFNDPDGNGWVLQEITTRLPGRVNSTTTSFASASDLATAMRRASVAHGEHEKRTGARTRTGPTGTPRTWSRSRTGRACPSRRDGRQDLPAEATSPAAPSIP